MTMETMQPTLKSGRYAWDRINMPVEEFQERVKKIRKGMKKEGIDVLLLYGNGFNEYGNYCYLSNTIIRLPQGAMVAVPLKGDVTLMFEGASRGVSSVKKMTWIDDVRASGDISKECINYLKEKNYTSSVVGCVGLKRLMPYHQLQFLLDSLPGCKVVDSDHILDEARMVKSRMEVLQIRRSSRIVVRAIDFIANTSFAEVDEKGFEAAARREVRLEGAEDFRMMIAKPLEERDAFRPPEERPLRPGDRLIVYLAIEFERYWAEAVRTFTFKDSSFIETYPEHVKIVYEKMAEGMKVGKRISQFHRETTAKIVKANVEYVPDYGFGQGIGLSLKELPVIGKGDRNILDEGMCFSLRLDIRDKKIGRMMAGNTIYLSKRGAEVLTR
jgi:Xaa-Pro aminopeptidase